MSSQAPRGDSAANDTNFPQQKPAPPHVDEIPEGMNLIYYIAECLEIGCDPLDVHKQLMTFGFSAVDAEKVMTDTTEWLRTHPHAGKPIPTGPLYWALSHSGIVVGVLSCLVGVTAFSWPANSDENLHYVIGGGAIIFGMFAVLWDLVGRVVR